MLMEICQTFAYQEGFKQIMVPRADSLYSYHHPFIRPELLPDARERALQRIRKSMELLYDANALQLGLIPDDRWFKWVNPNRGRAGARSRGAGATLPVGSRLATGNEGLR
jgi:hypothetical protein